MAAHYIGVDPGLSGGIAVLHHSGSVEVIAKMPETERDIFELFRAHSALSRGMLEFVRSMPDQGHTGAFTFGRGYGGLRMAMVAADIPFDEVTPQKWQQAMGCRTKGDKNISKRRAQELFPSVPKMTHAIADALLIAEYGRRLEMRG